MQALGELLELVHGGINARAEELLCLEEWEVDDAVVVAECEGEELFVQLADECKVLAEAILADERDVDLVYFQGAALLW